MSEQPINSLETKLASISSGIINRLQAFFSNAIEYEILQKDPRVATFILSGELNLDSGESNIVNAFESLGGKEYGDYIRTVIKTVQKLRDFFSSSAIVRYIIQESVMRADILSRDFINIFNLEISREELVRLFGTNTIKIDELARLVDDAHNNKINLQLYFTSQDLEDPGRYSTLSAKYKAFSGSGFHTTPLIDLGNAKSMIRNETVMTFARDLGTSAILRNHQSFYGYTEGEEQSEVSRAINELLRIHLSGFTMSTNSFPNVDEREYEVFRGLGFSVEGEIVFQNLNQLGRAPIKSEELKSAIIRDFGNFMDILSSFIITAQNTLSGAELGQFYMQIADTIPAINNYLDNIVAILPEGYSPLQFKHELKNVIADGILEIARSHNRPIG